MPDRRTRRRLAATLMITSLTAAAGAGSASAAAVTCDRFAAPFGSDMAAGNQASPFRTAQRLADALTAGQTGCLQTGTYSEVIEGSYVLRVNHGGRIGAPITIRSAPGARATLRGTVYVPRGSDSVTFADLDFDTRRAIPDRTVGIQVMAENTIFQNDDVTNHGTAICMVLGAPGWGRAIGTVIRANTFHDCGSTSNYLEHSLYVESSTGVLVTDNIFLRSGSYAVHLYPDAQSTTVTHNVLVDNGGGVIFAGEADAASSANTVSQNIITGSYRRPGIHSSWGATPGRSNVASSNCVSNPQADVDIAGGGFTAPSNLIASPGYRNVAARDYRLSAGSPCLAIVGYDTAAKLLGEPLLPTPAIAPTGTPTASPAPTATTTATATPSPAPTATAAPASTAAPPLAAVPTPTPSPAPTVHPTENGTAPQVDPKTPPVEAARSELDSGAFSASGGSPVSSQPCGRGPASTPGKRRARARCLATARR